jgi:hypothetical protein
MKTSEQKLRQIIRQVILEASDPNDPKYFSSLSKKGLGAVKDAFLDVVPFGNTAQNVYDMSKKAIGLKHQSDKSKTQQELYGFIRACEKTIDALENDSHNDSIAEDIIVKYFNRFLKEEGVKNYSLHREIGTEAGMHSALDPSILKRNKR